MCCLKYEQDAYEELIRTTPRVGHAVSTPDGDGVVSEVNLISGNLKIKLNADAPGIFHAYHKSGVKALPRDKKDPPASEKDKEKAQSRQK
jgi:cell fate regulator YaaT (PSP1 superfamily)